MKKKNWLLIVEVLVIGISLTIGLILIFGRGGGDSPEMPDPGQAQLAQPKAVMRALGLTCRDETYAGLVYEPAEIEAALRAKMADAGIADSEVLLCDQPGGNDIGVGAGASSDVEKLMGVYSDLYCETGRRVVDDDILVALVIDNFHYIGNIADDTEAIAGLLDEAETSYERRQLDLWNCEAGAPDGSPPSWPTSPTN